VLGGLRRRRIFARVAGDAIDGVAYGAADRAAPCARFLAMIVRAKVRSGRLVVDEPIDLPDGAELTLATIDDPLATELSDDERALLEASIETARAEAMRGEGTDGTAYIAKLRRAQ
jgi:hypothetical protein